MRAGKREFVRELSNCHVLIKREQELHERFLKFLVLVKRDLNCMRVTRECPDQTRTEVADDGS